MKLLRSLLIPHHTNTYKPHLIRRHGLALVLAMMFGIQLVSQIQLDSKGQVLGYASSISNAALLAETNNSRTANGLSPLSLNSKLNSAAQSKANHMIANDYWAHNAPDGTTPWYFFSQAGYSYKAAGENLAYGFDTSGGVHAGWMGSPGHRANVLSAQYTEVGFGNANGANFQGGPNTVVVAHYGSPLSATPAPATAAVESNTNTVAQAQPTEPAPEPVPKPTVAEPEPEQEPEDEGPAITLVTNNASPEAKRITNLEAIINGDGHWSLYATVALLLLVTFVYLYRHVLAIHNAVIRSEKFVVAHPLLEASLIYIVLWIILTQTHGVIL